jgi:type II restriction enzyme
MLDPDRFSELVGRYRQDPESVYLTWFVNGDARLKAFRAIRRGVEQVVADIKSGVFPNDFRGSSLETVLNSITEQKQVFEGAAHAFYWKPKLRIPDIYESEGNKLAFGQFLEGCLDATKEDQLIRGILRLEERAIKGLGPAAANILYFLHPTLIPPFNTAMLNGFNFLFGQKQKLGSWTSYLHIRDTILELNEQFRGLLSKDLGAISGLLFEIGTGRLAIGQNADLVIDKEREKLIAARQKRHREVEEDLQQEQAHTHMQFLLIRIGKALGYDVLVAANDRGRSHGDERFSFHCLCDLPDLGVNKDVAATVDLIDVLWFHKETGRVVCAFEVEKSTSIYSGILRLTDLVLALPDQQIGIYLVAPDEREREVIAQLKRPSIAATRHAQLGYLLFSDLVQHCESICRFGTDDRILDKIVKRVAR